MRVVTIGTEAATAPEKPTFANTVQHLRSRARTTTCDHRQTCGRIQLTLWGILVCGRNKRIPQLRADMSGCQEALLLTRQATPAMPLQEVSHPPRSQRLYTQKGMKLKAC